MFGKNVYDNFLTMATFCDGGHINVADALKKDHIYQKLFNGQERKTKKRRILEKAIARIFLEFAV